MHLRTSVRLIRTLAILHVAAGILAPGTGAQQPQPSAPRAATEPWRIIQPPQSSLVLARDGSLLGEIGREWRISVPLASLPAHVPQAFIAIEDQRFYQHDGVDMVGIAGAIKDAVRGNPRGASTITQQLVGNMHPEIIDRSDRSLGRKLREQAAAREMEKRYTKQQILEAYLNQLHFGHGWYGVETAARHYFGKGAAQLSVAEAATLAAVINGPAIYDPIAHPERARARRNLVLTQMAGQGFITRQAAAAAQAVPVTVMKGGGYAAPARYAVDVVRVQAERAGVPVREGGYRIHTTLDPAAQRAAAAALEEGLQEIEQQPGYRHPRFAERQKGSSDYLQGALVAMTPYTGDVLALVGGRDYSASPFNRAVDSKRQPGSAFKPMVYLTALSDSLPPNAIVADTAIAIPLENGTLYEPGNSDGEFLGFLTMREALARSRNPVAVQLGMRVGMDTVVRIARAMGINGGIAPYPSSAIGASAVQPLDLVAAYATIANLGSRVEARFITHVEDAQGKAVWQNPITPPQPAVDPTAAFIVRDMMRDVVERGTATSVRRFLPPDMPVAGKTGTTNDNTDVWFVGMTPGLVAGVWLGFDKPRTITPGAAGGTLAAPIWARFVVASGASGRGVPWTPPPTVVSAELDRDTGLLADLDTPPERRYTEYFLAGTEPLLLRLDSWELFRGRRASIR
jgi:penicillin-binding protein 1A